MVTTNTCSYSTVVEYIAGQFSKEQTLPGKYGRYTHMVLPQTKYMLIHHHAMPQIPYMQLVNNSTEGWLEQIAGIKT